MKTKFTLIFLLIAISITLGYSQTSTWTSTLAGNTTTNDGSDSDGIVTITSSIKSVDGGNPQFIKYIDFTNEFDGGRYTDLGDILSDHLGSVPVAKRLRAQAGVPFTITINTSKKRQGELLQDGVIFRYGIGKNEQPDKYDITNTDYNKGTITSQGNPLTQSFTITHTFLGRTEAWIALNLQESSFEIIENFFGIGIESYNSSTSIVIPFVVEGPYNSYTIDSLGVITEPKVPYIVLHKPPGDGSSSQITATTKNCRNFDESYSVDATNTTKASVKLGVKGSIGFVATIDYEIYAQLSGEVQTSNMNLTRTSKQTCVEVTDTWATSDIPASTRNGSDIFVGYGMDMVYGVARNISILPNYVIKDATDMYYFPILPLRKFALTKDGILADIASQQIIMNNTALSNKIRSNAKYQIDVWNQVLFKNDSTIAAANTPTGVPILFSAGADGSSSSTLEYSATNSIEVGHYVEGAAAIEVVVNIGGSGFSAGHEFRTRKSFGSAIGSGSTTANSISYTFKDNDAGDIFYVNKYKDPIYGTPIFKTVNGTRSSCPYEGGYQRDQPSLQIVGQAQNNITLSNITLGTPAPFQVKLCNNNSTEARSYKLGFVPQSNSGDLEITAAGSTGSDFGTFSVNANTCLIQNYNVNIRRRDAISGTNFTNLEFQFYPECDPELKSSVFANVSFAVPTPATVTTSRTEVCEGTPITLTATCPFNYTTNWYTSLTGGIVVQSGSSVSVNPTANTVYYVSCESTVHVPPRVASKLVLVGSPSTVLNLTTNFTTSSLQIANTTITANNKIFSPANVTYKAGNSLTFSPGFEAKSGSNFMARIGGCGN